MGYELLFLTIALGNIAAVVTAAARAKRTPHLAVRLLLAIAVFDAVYMAVVVAVSLTAPPHLVTVGRPQCFNDWCLTVDGFDEAPSATSKSFLVRLTVSSRARSKRRREASLDLYVVDERNRAYAAKPVVGDPLPQDIVLQPGQSVKTACLFRLPRGTRSARLILGHYGPGCLIIGQDCDRLSPRFLPLG